jgi:enoyl-CoA hydratase/carnithine racemase
MSEDPVLLCNDRNGVPTLTLNRPRRKNAINRDLWIALAAEARALNLVTWVVSAAEIGAFVTDVADRLVAGPAIALAQSKALLNEGADRTLRDALGNEARAQVVNFGTADAGEAYAAFAERREPSFTGRWAVSRSEQKNA